MAADLALVRCVAWGLLIQNSHGQAPRRALPCRADTVHICHEVLLLGLHSIFSLGLLVLPMLRLHESWKKTTVFCTFLPPPLPPALSSCFISELIERSFT